MARPKLSLALTPEQSRELQRLINAPATPQKLVRRARIALLAAQGQSNEAIATELATSTVTVGLWRQRFVDLGLAGLAEAPRPGRPPDAGCGKSTPGVERSGAAAEEFRALVLPAHGTACGALQGCGAASVGGQ